MLAGAAGAGALLLPLDDVDDQLQHLFDPGGLCLPVLKGLTPVAHMALGRELVEPSARDLQGDLGIRWNRFADLRARQLNAIDLDVAATTQLQPGYQLQRRQRGHLLDEALDGRLDQRLGVRR